MIKKNNFYGKCYYCVCTACSGVVCPFAFKLYRNCYRCHERGSRAPRLDCDYFTHYLKHRRFRFRKLSSALQHSGTYTLNVRGLIFVGRWSELRPIADRFGGELRPLDVVQFLTGDTP